MVNAKDNNKTVQAQLATAQVAYEQAKANLDNKIKASQVVATALASAKENLATAKARLAAIKCVNEIKLSQSPSQVSDTKT